MEGDSTVSNTQRVADDLRQRIIRGKFAPGERLKVESLKTLLDTGASPIREALSLLTSDQLVERIDQRGFRVAAASAVHFREILALRCQLDVLALKNSIDNATMQWEEKLVLTHHRLARADRQQIDEWETLHKHFHASLLSACDSPILLRFCDQLYDLNIRYRFLAIKSANYEKRDVTREHNDILQAVIDRNSELAVERLVNHYTLTGEFLVDQFA